MTDKISKPQTSIDDLPDSLLVEVLSRLPSRKFVSQCTSVSKRWCTIISDDPYFISRFISLHKNQTLPYLIDGRGREFPTVRALLPSSLTKFSATSKSSDHLLAPVFKEIKRLHSLENDPVVIQTFKDLVLCCKTRYKQRQYYICNPYTKQWVALPRTPSSCHRVAVGFICDPYYCDDEKADGSSSSRALITVNNNFRCKVVRIAPVACPSSGGTVKIHPFRFMVEIFSFETGEWRTTSVSSKRAIDLALVQNPGFSYNGMIYWMHVRDNYAGLIGLGPFTNYNATTSSRGGVEDHNKPAFCFSDLVDERVSNESVDSINCIECVHRGCLQVWGYDEVMNELIVWELKGVGSSGTLNVQHTRVFPVDHKIDPDELMVIGFDPKDDADILYVSNLQFDKSKMTTSIAMYNIGTREWSKIIFQDDPNGEHDHYIRHHPHLFRLVFPCWPTPVPRPPQHQQIHG